MRLCNTLITVGAIASINGCRETPSEPGTLGGAMLQLDYARSDTIRVTLHNGMSSAYDATGWCHMSLYRSTPGQSPLPAWTPVHNPLGGCAISGSDSVMIAPGETRVFEQPVEDWMPSGTYQIYWQRTEDPFYSIYEAFHIHD